VSILLLAWVFFASFVTTLLVVGLGPKLVKLAFALFMLYRNRHEIAGAAGLAMQPDEIHLAPAGADPWEDRAAAGRLVQGFEREGFRSAGVFSVPEMPGVLAQLFAHTERRLIGVVYEHPAAGHWSDVVERRNDGSTTTWTSARPTGLDQRPEHPHFYAPGASPADLLARALRERGPAPAEEVHLAELEALFERAYAEETAWRKNKGVSVAEVKRIEQQMNEAA
jgi:hypothetical protein